MKYIHLLLIAVLCIAYVSPAHALTLAIWHLEKNSADFILPIRNGETEIEAQNRYLKNIRAIPELSAWQAELAALKPAREISRVTPLHSLSNLNTPIALVMANDISDMISSKRMDGVTGALKKQGMRFFAAPILADAGLDAVEKEEFHRIINRNFDLLLSLGGDDIHPSTYHAANLYSQKTILSRDQSELATVRSFLNDGNGFFMGICRGHQMGAVAASCGLVQDLEKQANIFGHSSGTHKINWNQGDTSLWHAIFPQGTSIEVNSLHHQSIDIRPNPQLRAVAYDEHGVIEVLEYPNKRGLSFQFHPELMPEAQMTPLWKQVWNQANQVRQHKFNLGANVCEVLFKEL